MEVLDKNGLDYFWDKIKDYIDTKSSNVIKNYTLSSNTNDVTMTGLNIQQGEPFQIIIDGITTTSNGELVNVGCYPNNKTTFDIARVTGIQNHNGSVGSIYNTNTPNMYLGRVIRGSQFMIKGTLSWEDNFLKNLSEYSTPSINNYFTVGHMGSMISLADDTITSLRFTIADGQFVAGTKIIIIKLI